MRYKVWNLSDMAAAWCSCSELRIGYFRWLPLTCAVSVPL